MICKNCGKELPEGSMFCPACGANLTEESVQTEAPLQPQSDVPDASPAGAEPMGSAAPETVMSETETSEADRPQYIPSQPYAQAPAPKKKTGLIVAIAAVLIVAIAAVACFATGVFANPAATLAKAAEQTIEEYTAILENSKLQTVSDILEEDSLNAKVSLGVRSIYGDESFSGLGLTIAAGCDVENEKMNLALTPFYGSADIATIGAGAFDHRIFIGSPELLDNKYAGVDTLTVGQDLNTQLGVDGFTTVSFNIFDLVKEMKAGTPTEDKIEEKMGPSVKALTNALTVEKTGKETMAVNGVDTDVTAFAVTAPKAETIAVIDAYKEITVSMSESSDLTVLLQKIGIPQDIIDEYLGGYGEGSVESLNMVYDEMIAFVEENDGLQFACYVADGYLRAVSFSGVAEETDCAVLLEIGSESMITQTFRATVTIGSGDDASSVIIESTGDHIAATTLYLDTTTITIDEYGEVYEAACLNTEYDTKSGEFTFDADIFDGEYTLTLAGNLTGTGDSIAFTDGAMNLAEYGDTEVELSLDLSLGEGYEEFVTIDTNDYYDFATMSAMDWYAVASDLYDDAMELVGGLDSDLIELFSLFF